MRAIGTTVVVGVALLLAVFLDSPASAGPPTSR